MEFKILKGDQIRLKVKDHSFYGPDTKIITVECMNNKGRKKHYFDEQNGKDYRFSDSYIKENAVDDNGDKLFEQ